MSLPSNNAASFAPDGATEAKPSPASGAKEGRRAVAANGVKEGKAAVAANGAKVATSTVAPPGAKVGRRVRLRVGAEGARADLFAGWRKPRVVATQQVEFGAGVATLPEAIVALDPLLTALAAAAGSLKGLSCDVVIGDAWMLYDVVRADLRSLSPNAANDVVRSALADVAGVPPSDVVTRWQTQAGGYCTIACGMPAAVLPSIQTLLRAHRMHAGEIVGEFVYEYNAHRDRLTSRCAVVSLVRETGTQLAVTADGALTAMSFELGVRAPEELEVRGRSLLRGAGVAVDADTRFFALLPAGWAPPSPWIALPLTA